jgi:D-alanyl-lipoteichoic acid acyltransferase DltB (MBOAT superfamily)
MAMLFGFIPLFLCQIALAVMAHLHSRRRGRTKWVWFVLMLIPFVGAFFGWVLTYNTLLHDATRLREHRNPLVQLPPAL